ncbi:MAG: C25 family peptidase propeptide domain-containing protein, partial [Bacteroidota bacterium]
MLKRFSILFVVLVGFTGTTVSQELKKIPLTRVEKKFPGKEMVKDQGDKIILYEDVDEFFIRQKKTKDGYYQQLFAPGLTQSFDKGNPDLPLISRLIEIPSDAKVSVRVLRYDEEQVALNEHQQQQKIIPAQPSVSKSTDPKDVPFYKNKALYNTNRFYKKEIVQFKDNGYLRNKHLGYIEISPFQYNPVTNTLNILRNIEIEISFSKGSKSSDTDLKRLQSSYFDELDLKTINTVSATETKSLLNDPVKYVIVSDPMFEETLQPFIEWKTQKGFNVVDVYTDNPEVG